MISSAEDHPNATMAEMILYFLPPHIVFTLGTMLFGKPTVDKVADNKILSAYNEHVLSLYEKHGWPYLCSLDIIPSSENLVSWSINEIVTLSTFSGKSYPRLKFLRINIHPNITSFQSLFQPFTSLTVLRIMARWNRTADILSALPKTLKILRIINEPYRMPDGPMYPAHANNFLLDTPDLEFINLENCPAFDCAILQKCHRLKRFIYYCDHGYLYNLHLLPDSLNRFHMEAGGTKNNLSELRHRTNLRSLSIDHSMRDGLTDISRLFPELQYVHIKHELTEASIEELLRCRKIRWISTDNSNEEHNSLLNKLINQACSLPHLEWIHAPGFNPKYANTSLHYPFCLCMIAYCNRTHKRGDPPHHLDHDQFR